MFPIDIPLRIVQAATRPGDTVLDVFSGSGTTLEAAVRHGRRAIGIDVREDFHHLTLARLHLAHEPEQA